MSSWPRSTALFVIATIIVVVLAFVYFKPQAPQVSGPRVAVGSAAPSFTMPALEGGTSSLRAYRGRIVFLNLWATWCPPCRAEMPDLERFYQHYKSHDVVVLGIDQGESRTTVGMFVHSLGVKYPILLDKNQQYAPVFGAIGLPTSAIISPSGVVVKAFDGALAYPQMVAAIKPVLLAAAGNH